LLLLDMSRAQKLRAIANQVVRVGHVPRRINSWIKTANQYVSELLGYETGDDGEFVLRELARWLGWAMRMRANKGICSIEIASDTVGFFSQMVWCLYILQYCERYSLVPDLRLTGDSYLDPRRGPNWLQYYFDATGPMNTEEIASRVRYTKKISRWRQLGPPILSGLSLEDGARILYKYLHPKPHISRIVDDFWAAMGSKGPVVGVHFRGTDHWEEAPRVSYEHCLNVLKDYLHAHQAIEAVFVATDEQAFVDFIKKSMNRSVPVYSHNDYYRSTDSDNQPVFRKAVGEGGYEKGEDALVNALLLSKCSTLIRTTSCLSGWASIFNPGLKVILLNRPYDNTLWYPETEVFRRSNTQYVPERSL
jgi:hypothetical protein